MSEIRDIDHEYTQEIVCPFCGCEFIDSWDVESDKEDIGLIECGECEKDFYATRHIEVTYSTEKATYGTCKKCGAKNIVIESKHTMGGNYEDLCVECGAAEERRLTAEYCAELHKKYEKWEIPQ